MGILKLKISTARPSTYLTTTFERISGSRQIANQIVNFLTGILSGSEGALSATVPPSINVIVQGNETFATGTFTFTGAASASDTVLINGVTFTAEASGATGNQWNIGLTATATAANLAAAINGSVTALVAGYVTATSALGVVTVSSAIPSISGNMATIAKGTDSGSVNTASGARLTGGAADATAQTLTF